MGTLLILAVVAGVLAAGLALPVVGGTGLLAKAGGTAINKLGDCPAAPPLAQHSLLLAADGSTIATLAGPEDRVIVPTDAIPPVMQKSIVAIEDNRFYENKGVDLRGVLRAASADTSSGSYSQGASTITEQYVKLAQLEGAGSNKLAQIAATQKSIDRKLTDARCAIALEKQLSKAQILTDYLNIAYFGEGVYGVGTAAEHYFGVPVQHLTLAQAAMLAGLVNNPTQFDPVAHPVAAAARRGKVFDALAKYQLLPPAQIAAARAVKLSVHPQAKASDPCQISAAPVFCTYALGQLLADPKLGATQTIRDNAVYEGGLKITTSFNPGIQKAVNAGIAQHLGNAARQADVAVVMQPGTGSILAIGQNRGYGTGRDETKNVYAAAETNEVGSTFKLMTITAALEQGVNPSATINSPACFVSKTIAPSYYFATPVSQVCPHGVRNAGDSEAGTFNLYTGTWASVNTFFVQLESKIGGPTVVAQMAKRLGIVGGKGFQKGEYGDSLTLGSGGGFSAIDMATAYATIDAHGLACTPNTVSSITTLAGAPVAFTGSTCTQAVSPAIADKVTSILQGVLTTPKGTALGLSIGRPAAAKTGTTNSGDEAWFVGYVPQFVTAVGVFDPNAPGQPATPITDRASGQSYNDTNFYGSSIPGHTWQSIMEGATSGLPVVDFATPAATDAASTSAAGTPVPDLAGLPVVAAGRDLSALGFVVQVQSPEVDSSEPAGSVAYTTPRAGSTAPAGSTVLIVVSNGTAPAPTSSPPTPGQTVYITPSPAPTQPAKRGGPPAR